MNRVLFEKNEIGADGGVCVSGRRAAHIAKVLKPQVGAFLRVGVLDGTCGRAEVVSVARDRVALVCTLEDERPEMPCVDLLLAVPRPKVMRRLWAPLASLGIGHIVLTNAAKVERNYFDTHWLEEAVYRPLLVEGLEQSGDTRVPDVTICRQLKPLVEDRLGDLFPDSRRLICHPPSRGSGATGPREATPIGDVDFGDTPRVLLAIGPEGGWSDYEIDLFSRQGFDCVSMGWRALRTDVACIALIAAVLSKAEI